MEKKPRTTKSGSTAAAAPKSYSITNTNPSLISERELMIHPIIERYTDTIHRDDRWCIII